MFVSRLRIILIAALAFAVGFGLSGGAPSPAEGQGDATWTIMFYSTADTSDIEAGMMLDVNEVEYVGSTADVNFVAQVDRTDADPTWTDSRRFLLTQDGDWQMVNSPVVMSLGEVNQGEVDTLVDFMDWARQYYPADHYGLVLSDHGGGWTGFGWDMTDNNDSLTMLEIDQSLSLFTSAIGRKLDFIGFDACLMAQYEVIKMLAPYADYAILAQETEPAYGWSYDYTLPKLVQNPAMDAATLSTEFSRDYMFSYREGEWKGTGYEKYDLGVIDLSKMAEVEAAMAEFVLTANTNGLEIISAIGDARNNAQVFGGSTPDEVDIMSSVDLIHFLKLLVTLSPNADVAQAAYTLQSALESMVVYHDASGKLPGAHGIAIYFPRNQRVYEANLQYTNYEQAIPYMGDWVGFLQLYYGQAVSSLPPATDVVTIQSVFPDGPASIHNPALVNFNTNGQDIIEVVFSAALILDDGTQITLDESPLESADITEDGEPIVNFEDGFSQNQFSWGVEMPVITDGVTAVPTLLLFNRDDPDNAIISGVYYSENRGEVNAYLIVDLATWQVTEVWGVMEASGGTAPFEIRPQPGDLFLPTWRFLDENNEYVIVPADSDPLVFGSDPFTFYYEPAISGTYQITIRVEDIAGNIYVSTTTIEVDNEGLDSAYRGYTDMETGFNLLYPWGWDQPVFFTDEEEGTETIISNEDGSINLYISVYETESLDDIYSVAMDYVESIENATITGEENVTVYGYDGVLIFYTYETDGEAYVGAVLAVQVDDNGMGYKVDMDAHESVSEDFEAVVNLVAGSMNFFPPVAAE